jgi:hypothetical protein
MLQAREIHNAWPRLAAGLLLLGLALLLASSGNGQAANQSPSELIRSLSHIDRQEATNGVRIVTCGETEELRQERAKTRELVRLDNAAIPDLERALDSLEKEGQNSRLFRKAGWFLLAYARIQGPAATPRLRRMIRSPKLISLRLNLDQAIALSLGLTSYVSSLRERGEVLVCRRQEPRDALNQLIISFEQNDRSRFESSLGPNSRKALDQLLVGTSWEVIRQQVWHEPSGGQGAVGYLFDIPGRWSEPEETLEEKREYRSAPLASENFALDTQFKNSAGKDCARYSVSFRKIERPTGPIYQVDNSNIEDLLRSIGTCSAQ